MPASLLGRGPKQRCCGPPQRPAGSLRTLPPYCVSLLPFSCCSCCFMVCGFPVVGCSGLSWLAPSRGGLACLAPLSAVFCGQRRSPCPSPSCSHYVTAMLCQPLALHVGVGLVVLVASSAAMPMARRSGAGRTCPHAAHRLHITHQQPCPLYASPLCLKPQRMFRWSAQRPQMGAAMVAPVSALSPHSHCSGPVIPPVPSRLLAFSFIAIHCCVPSCPSTGRIRFTGGLDGTCTVPPAVLVVSIGAQIAARVSQQ